MKHCMIGTLIPNLGRLQSMFIQFVKNSKNFNWNQLKQCGGLDTDGI